MAVEIRIEGVRKRFGEKEVLKGIVGPEGAVAEHIDLAALEPRMKYQVMDIGEQHRFASGKGETAHGGLR